MWEFLQEVVWHALIHTLEDALKMLPFLFVAYLLLEYIEHRSATKLERLLSSNKLGPVGGALVGCVPQCGFSVAAANLYAGRVIRIGTLVAVFLSTSDEAIPLMLAHPEAYPTMFLLLGLKVVIAIVAGFAVEGAAKLFLKPEHTSAQASIHELCDHEHCHCERGIFRSALRHTLEVFGFILVVLFVLTLGVEWGGEDRIASLLLNGSVFQPLIAGLLGFIPNCAGSVLLTELYLSGSISFGAAVAGLCTSAGVGIAVLLRVNRNWRQNLFIIVSLYLVGVLSGLIIQLF